jgi:hypothetical protein|tara:strand:+ start:360 stop:608 length:249 start_codon:yes stop_codon:yes gene_type:complete
MMMSQKDLIQILQADMEARGDKMLSVWVWDREGFNGANGLDMIETQWDAALPDIDELAQRLVTGEDAKIAYAAVLEEVGYEE